MPLPCQRILIKTITKSDRIFHLHESSIFMLYWKTNIQMISCGIARVQLIQLISHEIMLDSRSLFHEGFLGSTT